MQFTRRAVVGFAGAGALFGSGCLGRLNRSGDPKIDVTTGLDESVIDVATESGVPEDITIPFSELEISWQHMPASVGAVVIGIDCQYGRLLERLDDGNWSDTSSYRPDVAPVSLFAATDAEPLDFQLEDGGDTGLFDLDFDIMVEILDRQYNQLDSWSGSERAFARMMYGDVDDDGHAMFIVRDEHEEPIEGARVRVFDESGLLGSLFREEVGEGHTNARGYVATPIGSGTYVAEAEHDDYGTGTSEFEVSGDNVVTRIVLPHGDSNGDGSGDAESESDDDTSERDSDGGEDDSEAAEDDEVESEPDEVGDATGDEGDAGDGEDTDDETARDDSDGGDSGEEESDEAVPTDETDADDVDEGSGPDEDENEDGEGFPPEDDI